MTYRKKLIVKLAFVFVAAAILIVLGLIRSGQLFTMGIGMAAAGVLLSLRVARTFKNEEKLRELENNVKDERIAFITAKSFSFSFWISIVGEFIAVCVLEWFGIGLVVQALCYVICFQVLAHGVSYLYYNKKY